MIAFFVFTQLDYGHTSFDQIIFGFFGVGGRAIIYDQLVCLINTNCFANFLKIIAHSTWIKKKKKKKKKVYLPAIGLLEKRIRRVKKKKRQKPEDIALFVRKATTDYTSATGSNQFPS